MWNSALTQLRRDGTIAVLAQRLTDSKITTLEQAIPADPRRPGYRVIRRAEFRGTTFEAPVSFVGVEFVEKADFSDARFPAGVDFSEAEFPAGADFRGARFLAGEFGSAKFGGCVHFDSATFTDDADFGMAVFDCAAVFNSADFSGHARFTEARFTRPVYISPRCISQRLWCAGVVAEQQLQIQTCCASATFDGANFQAGANLLLGTADVSFAGTDFGDTSLITGPRNGVPPRISSFERAKVSLLTISDADLSDCRFVGAFGLDKMTLDRVRFAPSPGWQRSFRWPRWTSRQTLAEEHAWRRHARHGPGWNAGTRKPSEPEPPEPQPPEPEPPKPEDVAGVYRALRKGFEDRKNEPGAADFYYGEMEMRRRATSSPFGRGSSWAERRLLGGHWAVSGYALRASRAFLALALVIVVATPLFDMYGFRDRVRPYASAANIHPNDAKAKLADFPPSAKELVHGFGSFEAWTYSAGTAVAVIGAPDAQLTQYGRAVRIMLRLLGALLLGLALLSIRGRVKR